MTPVDALARRAEAHVRRAWADRPGGPLRLAAAGFAAGAGIRNLLYDSGFLASRHASVPVVSVGGLTVGGSGKTPITADMAARLSRAGVVTAIVTHGFADEMDVHRRLSPESRVYGGSDRIRLAAKAADEGAQLVILDSGFQYRRMFRDLDILTIDDASLAGRLTHLPAGPHREGLGSLARADLIVTVRREVPRPADSGEAEVGAPDRAWSWLDRLAYAPGAPPFVAVRIRPGGLSPASEAARAIQSPEPVLAVAGVMWPEVFFAQVRGGEESVREAVALPDHGQVGDSLARSLRARAGAAGIVCTLKDASKLVRALGEDTPIWYVSEDVEWVDSATPPVPVQAALALVSPRTSHQGRIA